MNYYRDKEQWWQQVKQELLHPEEPPIPALLDTDRLTPHNIWPKAVLRRFVELVKEGKSHYEIAAILGQRFSSVRFHARVLFPRQGRHHQNWTNEEKHNVIKLTQAKRSVEEIMKVMDRSRYSVIIMQREIAGTRSRKCSLRTGREYLDWTDEEHQKLEKLALDGISPSEIAILMGRTRVAVKTRCRKLGLKYCWKRACYYLPDSASSPELRDIIGKSSEKLSPKAERRWRPWTEEEDQKIRGLALDGIFAAVIAEITGRTPAAIRKRCQNVLGLKYDRNRARYFPPDAASSPD